MLGPRERYMTPTLDSALLCSSREGADLGRASDGLRSFVNGTINYMPHAGFDPPGEKWQLCWNIVVALPPKPPRLDQP